MNQHAEILAAQGLPLGVVLTVLPAAVLVAAGLVARELVDYRRPCLASDGGLRLRTASLMAFTAGVGAATLTLTPLPFDLSLIVTAAVFALFAALITYRTRNALAAAFITVGFMGVGAAFGETFIHGLAQYLLQANLSAPWAMSMVVIWPLCGFPALVAAITVAWLSIKALPAPTIRFEQPQLNRR